jgi:hypothetical protein
MERSSWRICQIYVNRKYAGETELSEEDSSKYPEKKIGDVIEEDYLDIEGFLMKEDYLRERTFEQWVDYFFTESIDFERAYLDMWNEDGLSGTANESNFRSFIESYIVNQEDSNFVFQQYDSMAFAGPNYSLEARSIREDMVSRYREFV